MVTSAVSEFMITYHLNYQDTLLGILSIVITLKEYFMLVALNRET